MLKKTLRYLWKKLRKLTEDGKNSRAHESISRITNLKMTILLKGIYKFTANTNKIPTQFLTEYKIPVLATVVNI